MQSNISNMLSHVCVGVRAERSRYSGDGSWVRTEYSLCVTLVTVSLN